MARPDQSKSRFLVVAVLSLFVMLFFAACLAVQFGNLTRQIGRTNGILSPEFVGTWSLIHANGSSETITFHPDGTAHANDDYAYRWSVVDGVIRMVSWEQKPSSMLGYLATKTNENILVPQFNETKARMELRGAHVTLVRTEFGDR
jgi:hypothetical protein